MRQGIVQGCAGLIMLLLTACQAPPSVTLPQTSATALPLLSPASLGESHEVSQVLHGEYDNASFTLRAVVTVDASHIRVIGLNPMGLRAFTLNYDGQHITEQRAPQVPDALQAQRLLNDLQLAYWPLAALQSAWAASGMVLTEPYPGTRRLWRAGQLVAEVHASATPWQGRVWLRHSDFPYALMIDSTALQEDPTP